MRTIRNELANRRGSVMLIVIMVVLIISLVALLVLAASHYNSRLTANERHRKRAFYIAESGAILAIDSLNRNDAAHGIIYDNEDVEGGTVTVQVFDSTDFAWLEDDRRIIRSVGVSRNAVRRLEYVVRYAIMGYDHIPGPLYIEAEDPHFAGNVFTIQGGDHHWGDNAYNIPVPPGDHRQAVATIHDSTSIATAMSGHEEQIFTVDEHGNYIQGSFMANHDTLDLDALAAAFAGENGELADTTGWIIGSFPNDYKVSYLDGDFTVAGGGHSPSGGSALYQCPNCNGLGVVTCWGCSGTGYEWQARACATCEGTGKVDCSTCAGVGGFSCPDCGGTGGNAMECDSCYGSGLFGCMVCDGTGDCPICGGTGISKTAGGNYWSCYRCGDGQKNGTIGTGECPDCGGVGAVACIYCSGTGIDPTTGCATCSGTGVIICTDCAGSGKVVCPTCGGLAGADDRICHVCSGGGTQTCPWCNGKGVISDKGGGHGAKGTLGAGVLVVTGNLHISGQFEFTGLIIVLGEVSVDITGGGQGVHIWGSLLCRSVDFKIAGNADVVWCRQALQMLPKRPAGYQVVSVTEY
ncbi:MAG TPA: hypothetical protein ENN07_03530 [candidate division Zixibacteria bacterium]|nr:hypothetical protein [candidate division Zixibacteria bacterium]